MVCQPILLYICGYSREKTAFFQKSIIGPKISAAMIVPSRSVHSTPNISVMATLTSTSTMSIF